MIILWEDFKWGSSWLRLIDQMFYFLNWILNDVKIYCYAVDWSAKFSLLIDEKFEGKSHSKLTNSNCIIPQMHHHMILKQFSNN